MRINVDVFMGHRKVITIEPNATIGATVGTNLFWPDGAIVTEAELRGDDPSQNVSISAWSLILDIPPNVLALAATNTTGIYVITGSGTSATRQITSADGSVVITNPGGVAGNIDLSAGAGGGILPMVTGEIVSGQPVFMYFDDGSLFYVQVE
jgi:hypothetical protein